MAVPGAGAGAGAGVLLLRLEEEHGGGPHGALSVREADTRTS